MLDVESLCLGVGADPPVGRWCRRRTTEAQRLAARLLDRPVLAGIGGLVEFVTVTVGAWASIDNQASAVFRSEGKLLDRAKAVLRRIAENRPLAPGFSGILGHHQERFLRQRGEDQAARPSRVVVEELDVVETCRPNTGMRLAPRMP